MAKKSFKNVLEQTHITKKKGISGVFASTIQKEEKPTEKEIPKIKQPVYEEPSEEFESDTRQTFVISETDLEKLKDLIYHKKVTSDAFYSQKTALHDALQLLFKTQEPIPPRPDYIKKLEKSKTNGIKKKLKSNKQ